MNKKIFFRVIITLVIFFIGYGVFFAGANNVKAACETQKAAYDRCQNTASTCTDEAKEYNFCKAQEQAANHLGVPMPDPNASGSGTPGTPGPGSETMTNSPIPGTTDAGGIVPCGRGGQNMCTLCDLIRGLNVIIQYIMKIAIGVSLLAIAIGGILYTISAGESAAMEKAKSTIKSAIFGFVIILAAWLIINTAISALGANIDLGIGVTGWGEFKCNK